MTGKGKYNFLLICVVLFLSSALDFSHAAVVDKIIVVINDEIITQGEVDKILLPIYHRYKMRFSDEEELAKKLDAARRNVLERLIQDKLLLSEARRRGIEVQKKEIQEKIDEVRNRFSSQEEFEEVMMQENVSLSELEERFKERIMIDKLVALEIHRRVSISPSEVLAYYQKNKEAFNEPERVKLRAILIRVKGDRQKENAKELAENLLARLLEGSDFALLAKEYSEGPYAAIGGNMGWVKKGDLMETIDELIFRLDEGEISGILETELGYHIFKVEEKAPPRTREFQEVKYEVENMLFHKKVEKEVGEWVESLKEDAYIAFR